MSENCPRCGTSYHGSRLGICPRCLLGETSLIPPTLGGSVEILEEIGSGGMGTVHVGRHLRLDQTVAVKLLAPDVVLIDRDHCSSIQSLDFAADRESLDQRIIHAHFDLVLVFLYTQDRPTPTPPL